MYKYLISSASGIIPLSMLLNGQFSIFYILIPSTCLKIKLGIIILGTCKTKWVQE